MGASHDAKNGVKNSGHCRGVARQHEGSSLSILSFQTLSKATGEKLKGSESFDPDPVSEEDLHHYHASPVGLRAWPFYSGERLPLVLPVDSHSVLLGHSGAQLRAAVDPVDQGAVRRRGKGPEADLHAVGLGARRPGWSRRIVARTTRDSGCTPVQPALAISAPGLPTSVVGPPPAPSIIEKL